MLVEQLHANFFVCEISWRSQSDSARRKREERKLVQSQERNALPPENVAKVSQHLSLRGGVWFLRHAQQQFSSSEEKRV